MIQTGDRVRIHYQTRSKQGNIIETSEHDEPLEFIVGSADVVAGLNLAVSGMQLGEKKHVILSPELAFGYRNPRLQQAAPRIAGLERAEDGDQLTMTCAGRSLDVWVRGVNGDEVILDANHPLTGESLVLDLQVIGINESTCDSTGVATD